MTDRLEVRLHGQPVGWIARGSRRERIEFEWVGEYTPERWNALGVSEAERIVTETFADFATALDHVAVPQGVPAAAAAQLAWNVERLQSGGEIGERPRGYRRRRS